MNGLLKEKRPPRRKAGSNGLILGISALCGLLAFAARGSAGTPGVATNEPPRKSARMEAAPPPSAVSSRAPRPARESAARKSRNQSPRWENFRLFLERNIFSAFRRAGKRRQDAPSQKAAQPRSAPPPALRLYGTMIYGTNAFAFFGGSLAKGAFSPGQEVSGFQLERLDSKKVVLQRGEKTFELKVGQVLVQLGEDRWETRNAASAPLINTEGSKTLALGGPETKQPSANSQSKTPVPEDIMRRLMERRRRELGQ